MEQAAEDHPRPPKYLCWRRSSLPTFCGSGAVGGTDRSAMAVAPRGIWKLEQYLQSLCPMAEDRRLENDLHRLRRQPGSRASPDRCNNSVPYRKFPDVLTAENTRKIKYLPNPIS